MAGWLSHLKVLDLSDAIAGPFCGKLLAQLGAEVYKIEPPGSGDSARALAPFYKDMPHREGSGLFLYLNSSKKSVTLNINTPAGAGILKELVRDVDVVVEGYDPGQLGELGLSYEELSGINPKLVMASITQFGQTGPYRKHRANELIQNAISGLMFPTGFPEREPIQSGGFLPQYKSGLVGAIGILAALQWRDMNGLGQHLDISIMEVVATFLETTAILYTYQGVVRGRTGSTLSPPTPLCDLYDCKEGHMIIAVLTQQQWTSLCEMIGHPEIIEDPRFNNPRDTDEDAKEFLWDAIGAFFAENTSDEAFDLCQLLRIPSAKVMTSKSLLEDPHLAEREFFTSMDHPLTGPLSYPGPAFSVGARLDRPTAAPMLGQDNHELYYGVLGYSSHEVARLGAMGVI